MATKKKSAGTAGTNHKNTTRDKGRGKRRAAEEEPQQIQASAPPLKERNPSAPIHQVIPCLFAVCAVFFCVCFLANDKMGVIGEWIYKLSFGLFGTAAWCIPPLMIIRAATWQEGIRSYSERSLTIFSGVCLVLASVIFHAAVTELASVFDAGLFPGIRAAWTRETADGAVNVAGGGVIGALLGQLMLFCFNQLGTMLITIPSLAVMLMFSLSLTPKKIHLIISYKRKLHKEKQEVIRAARKAEEARRSAAYTAPAAPETAAVPPQDEGPAPRRRRVMDENGEPEDLAFDETDTRTENDADPLPAKSEDIPEADEDAAPVDERIFREVQAEENGISRRATLPTGKDCGKRLSPEMMEKYFGEGDYAPTQPEEPEPSGEEEDDDVLEVVKKPIGKAQAAKEPPVPPEPAAPAYLFPPIELLKRPERPKNTDIENEISVNAAKLVKTLESFRVMTHVVSTSHGPTITRYELAPEPGVRVRAVANLVDDIALSLATTGVRIEAPIPGKAAIGVEVPNKIVSTVNVRELIETEAFRTNPSKINVALGKDVAGAPVFCDIAKMPHVLIAGATGMGKSVCINSIIISLLYKATPDEVKLILIDPKKVEFNIYKDIPQLLVPVVSDPKKAAGALQWAVTEMERRFEIIESVGVREIKGYNEAIKELHDDVKREPLSQIVIIIDELADLMMTAPDAVEEAICRLAQKARAAGMHLIIGTQRPSVDVITGLIKANIPSRIAFTVASQVDSRTIIDIAGAEKLIGRGDMLYSPVGAAKPRRVQGAFVSDKEVEAVTDFIKAHFGCSEYDDTVVESIEKAAARCAGKSGGDASESTEEVAEDPKFREAVELAIAEGKISTSLIQRRLQLGYGRAAKLIDLMESRGIVSPPDGQKPRTVLISRQDFMEMVVNDDEKLS